MRTTLDIDYDVLQAAEELARRERKTAGRIVSELARRGLTESKDTTSKIISKEVFLGFGPFPRRGTIVTNEMIDRLREEYLVLKRALLDINVLIALLDLDHLHRRRARRWLQREAGSGWASCTFSVCSVAFC
ncbi:MAG: hypothetical protein WB696_20255 [Chthoniobacterales bacterium]